MHRLINTKIFLRTYATEINQLKLTFASPTKVVIQFLILKVYYNSSVVKQVDVPSFSGNFGVLANHVPTLGLLKPGVVKIFEEDGNTKEIFVTSGTVTINADSTCQILAEEAVPMDHIDQNAVKDTLHKYQQDMSRANDKEKAELSIGVEVLEALGKVA